MKLSRLYKKSGSALVWAVCAMMVLTFAVAGILTLSLSYFDRCVDDAVQKKAELLAQSGIEYAKQRIDIDSSDTFDPESDDGKWKIEVVDYGKEFSVHCKTPIALDLTDGKGKDTEINIYVEDVVRYPGSDSLFVMKMVSVAQCGSHSAECRALFTGGGSGDWVFYGYTE